MSYFVMVVTLLIVFLRSLGPVGLIGVGGVLALLGTSAVIDELFNITLDLLVEDGFKFLGVCLWSTTWAQLAQRWQRHATDQHAADPVGDHR